MGLVKELGRRRWTNLLVEGGAGILVLFDADLVDEVEAFVAPLIVGGCGPSPVGGIGTQRIADGRRLRTRVEILDGDIWVRGRKANHLDVTPFRRVHHDSSPTSGPPHPTVEIVGTFPTARGSMRSNPNERSYMAHPRYQRAGDHARPFPWSTSAQVPESVCRSTTSAREPNCRKEPTTLIVNSRRIRLNYAINDVGPSGFRPSELWATRDGKSWARYSNEPPPDGPLVVHVADEGRYGFSIAVRNGVGVSSGTPKLGDEPQVWVVVDETSPEVKIGRASVGQGHETGTIAVEWSATDERLTVKPVTLSVSTRKDGPWTPIATSIENTGRYVWHMPRDHPMPFMSRSRPPTVPETSVVIRLATRSRSTLPAPRARSSVSMPKKVSQPNRHPRSDERQHYGSSPR
jgi:hypothetical protein